MPQGSRERLIEEYCDAFEREYLEDLRDELARSGIRQHDCISYCHSLMDISAGTELTITIPIQYAGQLKVLVEAFTRTCRHFGDDPAASEHSVVRAGLHMSFLWTEELLGEPLQLDRLQNFKDNVHDLKLAIIYLGSVGGRTRSLDFRNVHNDQRGVLCYHDDTFIEFRSFDPCYAEPAQILGNFLVMVRTLDFFEDEVDEPVQLTGNYWDLVPPLIDGPHDRWGWFTLGECFYSAELRQRLLQEVAWFAQGPLSTQRAIDAKKIIASWK